MLHAAVRALAFAHNDDQWDGSSRYVCVRPRVAVREKTGRGQSLQERELWEKMRVRCYDEKGEGEVGCAPG